MHTLNVIRKLVRSTCALRTFSAIASMTMLLVSSAQMPLTVSNVTLTGAQIPASATAVLAQFTDPWYLSTNDPCSFTTSRVANVTLRVAFDAGENTELFDPAETTPAQQPTAFLNIHIRITDVNNNALMDEFHPLTIDRAAPEITIERDITSIGSVHQITITKELYGGDPGFNTHNLPSDQARVRISLTTQRNNDVGPVPTLIAPVLENNTSNQVHFRWYFYNMECLEYPEYQIQILKLSDHVDGNGQESVAVLQNAPVDWSKALDLSAGSNSYGGIVATLAEGTGFYAWRVRPIGDYFDGGITEPRNWGPWSDQAPFANLPLSGQAAGNTCTGANPPPTACIDGTSFSTPAIFFYRQFDDDRNWSYSRVFSEGGAGTTSTQRVAESMTYATDLGQVQQEQSHRTEGNILLATQTVYDLAGRPAVKSLPVPVPNHNSLGYVDLLMTPAAGGDVNYTAADFDKNTVLSDNDPVDANPARPFSYYSGDGPAEVPSAEGYPFSRTWYYSDGRPKEVSGPGSAFAFDGDAPKATVTYYSGVNAEELTRIFGNEAYDPLTVHQVITIDPNGVTTTSYQDKEGKVLATSLVKTDATAYDDDTRTLLGLASEQTSQEGTPVVSVGHLSTNQVSGLYTSEAEGLLHVDPPGQTVTFTYTIDPSTVTDDCAGFCRTCDYRVELFLLNTEHPDENYMASHALIIPVDFDDLSACTTQEWTTSFDVTGLPPGEYQVRKIVTTNNDPDTQNNLPEQILQGHLSALQEAYETQYGLHPPMAGWLDMLTNNNLEGFIDVVTDHHPENGSFTMSIGCQDYTFPVDHCAPCVATPEAFLDHLQERYNAASTVQNPLYSAPMDWNNNWPDWLFKYPESGVSNAAFTKDEFIALINNMAAERDANNALVYDCEKLQGCWYGAVDYYITMLQAHGLNANHELEVDLEQSPGMGDLLDNVQASNTTTLLHLMDIFLDCAGRHMIGWSQSPGCDQGGPWAVLQLDPTDPSVFENPNCSGCTTCGQGYLTNAYAYIGFSGSGPYSIDCTPLVGGGADPDQWAYINIENGTEVNAFADGNDNDQYPDLWNIYSHQDYDDNGDPLPLTTASGWDLLYACMMNTAAPVNNSQGIDLGDPDAVLAYEQGQVLDLETQCATKCAGMYPVFVSAVQQLVSDDLITLNTADEVYCIASTLVDDCSHDCYELSIENDENGIPRIVSAQAIQRIKNILFGHFDLAPEVNDQCPDGYEPASNANAPSTDPDNPDPSFEQTLLTELNAALNDFADLVIHYDPALPATHEHNGWTAEPTENVAHHAIELPGLPCRTAELRITLGKLPDYIEQSDDRDVNVDCPANGGPADFGCMDISVQNHLSAFVPYSVALDFTDDDQVVHPLLSFIYGLPSDGVETSTFADMLTAEVAGYDPFTDVKGRFVLESGTDLDYQNPSISGGNVTLADFPYVNTQHPFNLNYCGSSFQSPLLTGYNDLSAVQAHCGGAAPTTFTYQTLSGMSSVDCCREGPKLCIKWSPGIALPEGEPDHLPIMTCAQIQSQNYLNLILPIITQSIIDAQADFTTAYQQTCANPANVNDHLSWTCQRVQHHFTLYYYDRAGNLIRTVPPDGVLTMERDPAYFDQNNDPAPTSTWKSLATHHVMPSTYVHNSLGQAIKQTTPDGGTTRLFHDAIGRVRLSQNDRQQVAHTFSYTKYDPLGRVVETGESSDPPSGYTDPNQLLDQGYSAVMDALRLPLYADYPNGPGRRSVTRTTYSEPAPGIAYVTGQPQRYLANRVSYSVMDENGDLGSTNDQTSTYYSYDPHGNVEWIVQRSPGIPDNFIAYDYDLISGRVLQVRYNETRLDQFFQRYTYDADGRITQCETSADGIIWDRDARYSYFDHGPLKRTLLGEDQLQGIDHTYTVQGWLKGINDPVLSGADAGHDGTNTSHVGKDAFGMMLSYFRGDYIHHGSAFDADNVDGDATPFEDQPVTASTGMDRQLYNGNIGAWAYKSGVLEGGSPEAPHSYLYHYDVLNRIRKADHQLHSSSWSTNTGAVDAWSDDNTDAFGSGYTYDGNGNLRTLQRKDGSGGLLDNFSYTYPQPGDPQPNALSVLHESTNGMLDDDIATDHEYHYDLTGQLLHDYSSTANISITWTPLGKVSQVDLADGHFLRFLYNANGQRVMKGRFATLANAQNLQPQPGDELTYYINDPQGNLMATYVRTFTAENGGYNDVTRLDEQPIYGSGRLGMRKLQAQDEVIVQEIHHPNGEDPFQIYHGIHHKDEAGHLDLGMLYHQGNSYSIVGYSTLPASNAQFAANGNTVTHANHTDNVYRAEDEQGNTLFTAYTVKQQGQNNSVLYLRDRDGVLMWGSQLLKSDRYASTISAQVPGQPLKHWLFTIGTDHKPYAHLIDLSQTSITAGEVTASYKLTSTNDNATYGAGMAVIDDRTPYGKPVLYLRRYAAGNCQLIAVDLQAFSLNPADPVAAHHNLGSAFASNDTRGGMMQISKLNSAAPQLAVVSRTGNNYGWYNLGTLHLRLYSVAADRLNASYVSEYTEDQVSCPGMDFSPSGQYIYFVRQGLTMDKGGAGALTRVPTANMSTAQDLGHQAIKDVRRTAFDEMISRTAGKVFTVHNPDLNITANSYFALWNSANGPTPLSKFALQPHILYMQQVQATRVLGNKRYELTDHLGNVRDVISDIKLVHRDAGNNFALSDFRADLRDRSDYYPFGMLMPGRNYTAGTPYRFGFDTQERDDEVFNSAGTCLTAEFWEYDTRTARRWNIDPVNVPSLSPYHAFALNPIFNVDPKGDQADGYVDENGNYLGDDGDTESHETRVITADKWKSVVGEDDQVSEAERGQLQQTITTDEKGVTTGNSKLLSQYESGINISEDTWTKLVNHGGTELEPWLVNNSGSTVYYKPEGLIDGVNQNPYVSSAGAYPVGAGLSLYSRVDGVATKKYNDSVFKVPTGADITITSDGGGDMDYYGIGWWSRGSGNIGWVNKAWLKVQQDAGDNSWNQLFQKAAAIGKKSYDE